MDNLLNILRLNHLFNPTPLGNDLPEQGGIAGNLPRIPSINIPNAPNTNDIDNYDPSVRMKELYHPDNQMQDRYIQTLDSMPQKNEHVGIGHKILGVLASIGGKPDTYDKITQGDYYDGMDTWKKKLDAIGPGLTYEKSENINNRTLANNTVQRELDDKKNERIINYGTRNLDIKESKVNLDKFKAEHPNWVLKETKGGNYVMFNPQDPTKTVDTGIATGTLSDLEKEKYGIEKIHVAGEESRKTEGVKQGGRVQLEKLKEANPNWKLVTTKGGNVFAVNPRDPTQKIDTEIDSGTLSDEDKIKLGIEASIEKEEGKAKVKATNPTTPGQADILFAAKARKALAQHPEWRPYITIDDHNKVNMKPRNSWMNDQKQYDAAFKALYGDTEDKGNKVQVDPKRQKAIDQLNKDKKPVTEANIKWLMGRMQ